MIKFIDLYAGIGGFRLAFEAAGGRCVFTSETDRFARQTYHANFGEGGSGSAIGVERLAEEPARLPDFDVLCAGFPCQPFSIAGQRGGLDDPRGGAVPDLAKILLAKRPAAFLLENVPQFKRSPLFLWLAGQLAGDYWWSHVVMCSGPWVPQRRRRLFMAGCRRDLLPPFNFAAVERPAGRPPLLGGVLESDVADKYTLSQRAWASAVRRYEKYDRSVCLLTARLVPPTDQAPTLCGIYGSNNAGLLMVQRMKGRPSTHLLSVYGENETTHTLTARAIGSYQMAVESFPLPRRLTPRECARLMGFPDGFEIPVSDSQAYKQFGNSVVVPQVAAIARALAAHMAGAPAKGQGEMAV